MEDETDWEDEERGGDEEDATTIPCPYCRQEVFEDSPHCPHCGQYISEEDRPASPKSWWIIVGALLCLLVISLWIIQKP